MADWVLFRCGVLEASFCARPRSTAPRQDERFATIRVAYTVQAPA
jgi:hypothetical protein